MLILTNAGTDKLQLISSSTSALDVHASYIDASTASPPVPDAPTKTNTAISTATTTDIVATPAASKIRNVKTLHIRNKGTASNDVTVQYNQNGTLFELHKATLLPGDMLEYIEGVGFFKVSGVYALTNKSTAAQSATFTADTYITGSSITIPGGLPIVGTTYICSFDMTKTAAGVAASVISLRVGTAGSTADTARCTFTLSAGTAAADTGIVTVTATFRTVGSGTSAVLVGKFQIDSNPTTGITSLIHAVSNVSSGFDSTVANSIIGLSWNGGTAFSGTVQQVTAELRNY